jgi:hypothetical protein
VRSGRTLSPFDRFHATWNSDQTEEELRMSLTRLAGECPDGNTCPAIFAKGDGTLVVQGRRVGESTLNELRLGEDEDAIEIPRELLEEASRRC